MNEIRKNKEEEVEQLKLSFKVEPIIIILYLVKVLISIAVVVAGVVLLGKVKELIFLAIIFMVVGGIVAIWNVLACIFRVTGVNKSEIFISNQRIYGKYGLYINKKQFSYRLDEIDNVEIQHILGARVLAINFQDGKGPKLNYIAYGNNQNGMSGPGMVRFSSVSNYQEAYDVLTKMLLSVKTNKDLMTDIEMEKVSVEKEKAGALNKMADNIKAAPIVLSNGEDSKAKKANDIDYIEEIKKLKELLDAGAITQAEFDNEKKEILDNNHKA